MRAPAVSVRLAMGAGALLCAATVASLAAEGVANAASLPSVTGQKYSDAQTALTGAGFTPVVSTTVGDQKDWSDCLVTNVVSRTKAAPPNSSGSSTNEALVSLNCYAAEASNKGSGYSAASPEGQSIAAAASSSAAAASSSAAAAGTG